MNIDKIFIINLKHRTDRKEHVLKELKEQNITNYEFFEAIKPTTEEVNKWNPNYCHYVKKDVHPLKFENYRIGCLGCLKSHLEIIKLSLERNYNNILILEDDTKFVNPFTNLIEYSDQIHNTYDMLYLSGSHCGKKETVSNNIIKIEGTNTTGSYLITKNVMEHIVKNINNYDKEIDVFYSKEIQPKYNCYCVIPHITHQLSGYSDIQQSLVNYGHNWNM